MSEIPLSKAQLAIILSKLEGFEDPQVRSEQYATDSEVAAEILHHAAMLGDIVGKRVLDLGSGTGILSLGALLLGAKQVIGVEKDEKALKIARNNTSRLKSEGFTQESPKWVLQDIQDYTREADTCITNPPFGTKVKGQDLKFLKKGVECANTLYFFHKTSTKEYISGQILKSESSPTHVWDVRFGLPQTYAFHHRRRKYIEVSVVRASKDAKTFK